MTPIPDLADQSSDLVGTKTQSTRDSLLTFGDLELKKTGTLYLKAFSPDVASADCSKMITVTAGEASFLALSGQPESIEAGSPFILHIEAYDWAGNLADASPLLLTIKSDEDPYAAFTDPALLDHGVANLTVTLNTPGTEVDAPNGSCAGILLRVNTQPLIATPAHCVSGWSSRDLLLTGSSGSTYSASDIRFYPGYDAKLVGRAPAGVAGSYDLALVIPDRAILDTEKPVSYPAEIAQEVIPGAGFESWGFSPNAKDPKTQDLITEPVSFMTSGADPNLFEISSEPTQTLQGSLILQTFPESTSGYRILGLATAPLDDHSVGVNLASFDFTTDGIVGAEIGGNLNLSGGFMWAYDGFLPVEHGFHLWPDNVEA
ncbi:MAG: hypothetical protein EBX52_14330, partial [Proteobacteria bacterium]|nr:hypothetical protein [Pseudomonadota bacterium]